MRKTMILQGYWLAQVCYYLAFQWAGWDGLTLLKAVLLTTICFILWRILVLKGVNTITALLLALPVVPLSVPFVSLRPHVFSFIGCALFFFLIEKGFHDIQSKQGSKALILLPLITLFWANLHPGVYLAHFIVAIYLLVETVKYVLNKSTLSPTSYKKLVFWLLTPLAVSLLSPIHLMPVIAAFRGNPAGPFSRNIEEYMPLWRYYPFTGDFAHLLALVFVAVSTSIVMIWSWRELRIAHVLLYLGLAAAGLASFRFTMFFGVISIAICSEYAAPLMNRRSVRIISKALVPLLLLLTLSFSYGKSVFSRGVISDLVPRKAADFIMEKRVPSPIFNPYEWGGYLIWHLYPRYKVYIDGRTLEYPPYADYLKALNEDPPSVLDNYGVKTVMFYYLYQRMEPLSGLVFTLLLDPGWELVYADHIAVIFVRKQVTAPLEPLSKASFALSLATYVGKATTAEQPSLFPELLLGQLYYVAGNLNEAEIHFTNALRISPGHEFAVRWLNYLRFQRSQHYRNFLKPDRTGRTAN